MITTNKLSKFICIFVKKQNFVSHLFSNKLHNFVKICNLGNVSLA